MAASATVIAVTSGQAAAATTDGGFWHLDETSGTTAVDGSGNGGDAIIHGAVQTGLSGHLGTAYSFAADGSWLEVPSRDGLNPGTRNFSVSAWVKLTTAPVNGVTYDIIRKGLTRSAGGEFKLEVVKNGLVRCTAKDKAGNRVAITGPKRSVADGQWHLIGCSRVGGSWRVTVDSRTKSRATSIGSISNTRSLSIGSKYGQEDGTPGLVDEVQFTID